MGVPTHRVEIRKEYRGHSWSNDYLVESPSMDEAEALAVDTVAFERQMHTPAVNFVYMRISSMARGDRIFRHLSINLPGEGWADTEEHLPLFNTVRMDLATADSDPCRKYYRLPLHEAFQSNGVILPASVALWQGMLAGWITGWAAGTKVVSLKGHNVVGGTVYPIVQMRQLNRHRRKKILV
jgi:hypothetical protein